jgi:sugar phosphate isomerase/epimerase
MPERVENSIRSVVEIADYCAENGISVGVELLPGPDFVGGCVEELIRLLDLAGRANVGVWLDVNHVFPHDQLSAVVESLGPRIIGLHISDYDGVEEKHWLPKQGVIDWKRLIGDLTRVGYVGPFTYEARFDAADLDEVVAILEENYYSLMSQAGE